MMAWPLQLATTACLLWLIPAGVCRCAEPPSEPGMEPEVAPLQFRRMYAPAEHTARWPIGDEEYWPVAAEEFERLLEAARAGTASAGPTRVPRIAVAEYDTRLVGKRWLEGRATLSVEYTGSEPRLLPLSPWGPALREARWDGEPPTPASVGTGRDGVLAVLVEKSGQLELEWSTTVAAEAVDVSQRTCFSLELPPCPISRLWLTLPAKTVPQVDRGIVVAPQQKGGSTRRWRVELGSHHQVEVCLVPVGAKPIASEVRLRETSTYDFSRRGLDLSVQWQLEVRNRPLRELAFRLDPELVLASARYGDKPVPWVEQPRQEGNRVVLELPDEVLGTARTLQLRALAPIQVGRAWRLPRIYPEKAVWEKGTLTAVVPSPLVLGDVEPMGCRQIDAAPLASPREGESARFRCYQPDATLQVELCRPESSLELISGTRIHLGPEETAAETLAAFQLDEGARYVLEARVARGWLIDAVESIPPGLIDSAPVVSPPQGGRRLRIRLTKGLSSSQPVRLRIAARRFQAGTELRWPLEDLLPLEFLGTEQHRRLVTIEPAGGHRLKTSGAVNVRRVESSDLDDTAASLFSSPPQELLFEYDAATAGLQVELQAVQPAYTAKLHVEATAARTSAAEATLRESYTLECVPQGTRVDRLVVHFSHRRPDPPRFSMASEEGQEVLARRLQPDEQPTAGFASEGELWALTLRRPRSVPFEIRAVREVALGEEQVVSLVSLSEASDQTGTLAIHSRGVPLKITHRQLEAIPTPVLPIDQVPTIRAAFRYDPTRNMAGSPEPMVAVGPRQITATTLACIWSCQLESRYQPDGGGEHRATYRLQNSGCDMLRLVLPRGASLATVRGVWIDGRQTGYRPSAGGLSVSLPARQRFPTVAVAFHTGPSSLATVGSLAPPLPAVDLPLLARQWIVWLPPDYAVCAPDPRWQMRREPPPSWAERMLGPLGRPAGQPPFDLTAADDWLQLARGSASERRADQQATQLLQALGSLSGERNPPGPAFWGSLLADRSLEAIAPMVLVDGAALARLELGPESPLAPANTHSALDRGLRLLDAADLALLVADESVVFTSRHQAMLDQAYVEPLGPPFVFRVRPGPLFEQIRLAAEHGASGTITTVATWRGDPPQRQQAWSGSDSTGFSASDAYGWTAACLELPGSHPLPVRLQYVHRPTLWLLGWVALFAVVGLGWWLVAERPLWLLGLLAVFGCLSLLVAEPYLPIASGIVLGLLFCLVRELIRQRLPAEPPEPGDQPSTVSPLAPTATHVWQLLVVLACCAAGAAATARGQSPAETPGKSPSEPYRVFIPVDAERNPTGGRYQVPAEFYRQLQRRAAGAIGSAGWLIGEARYRGSLSRDVAGQRFVVDELRGSFELQVFDPREVIRLPLPRRDSRLAPDGLLLDGTVVQPEWDPSGEALVFQAAEPGVHQLELILHPVMLPAGFDVAIPRLATGRLELGLAPGVPMVEVPTARGLVRLEDDPSRLVAELGPADRLSARWMNGNGTLTANGSGLEVQELLWLKVKPEPGTSIVDVQFAVRSAGEELRQLRLGVDPGLRLLEIRGENPPKAEVSPVRVQPTVIDLTWSEPVGTTATVEASFVMARSPGAGRLSLPRIELLDARTTRRWLAVSLDPTLERIGPRPAEERAVAVPEFLDAWGETEDTPQAVSRIDGSSASEWNLAVRPREPQTSVRQALALSFDRGYAEAEFDAELNTVGGYRFQYRLRVPDQFFVEQVSVREEETERVARWAPDGDGRVVVFLDGPAAGRQTLNLRGRWEIDAARQTPLPEFAVETARQESSVVELFRRPGALVAISRIAPGVEVEAVAADADQAHRGRFVARLRSDAETPIQATLGLAENRPRVRAEQLVRLTPETDTWKAEFNCRIEVNAGVLDEITLQIPDAFPGPYTATAEPPVDLTVVEQGEERRLLLRPKDPITAGFQFRVTGPLRVEPGRRPESPHIQLLAARRVRRLFSLPLRDGQRTLGWETRGLKPTELPDGFPAPSDANGFATFEAIGQPNEALLIPSPPSQEKPRVVLADVYLAWHADGTFYGVTTFDLKPGSTASCPLILPSGCHLVQATVGDVPVTPESAGANRYELPLGPHWIAQRVGVVFGGSLPSAAGPGAHTFEAPSLGDMSVEQTLWTVVGPPLVDASQPIGGKSRQGWTQDLARLQALSELIEASTSGQLERQSMRNWYSRWIRRLETARAALLHQLRRPGVVDQPESVRSLLRDIDQRQSQIAARLGTADLLAEAHSPLPPPDGPAGLWKQSLLANRDATRCSIRGPAATLTLNYQTVTTGTLLGRLLAAFTLLALVAAAAWALWHKRLFEWFCRWPAMFGVALGLSWWMWLSPSLLGWAIVLGSLAVAVLSAWRRSTTPPGSSVIAIRSLQS